MNSVTQYRHNITRVLSEIISGICQKRNHLEIRESLASCVSCGSRTPRLTIEITPHPDDYRLICGRKGSRINAIKSIASLAGKTNKISVIVNLVSNGMGEPSANRDDFVEDPNFDNEALKSLVSELLAIIGMKPIAGFVVDGDKTNIAIPTQGSHEELVVHGMHELFYSYGFKNGRKIEISIDGK